MRAHALTGLLLLLTANPAWSDDRSRTDPSPADLTSLPMKDLMQLKVEGAALHPQSLEEAPASVTVITAEDIYRYGYRTLAEALSSVRGFFITNDRTYQSVGVRGFGLPGDYGSRILVTVNGHNLADNIFDSMLWFGPDFPIEMNLMKRIEIIRGPSSALYGSSGILATINIITKAPQEIGPPELSLNAGTFGEKKARITTQVPLGRSAQALISASVFRNAGESPLSFPELASAANASGRETGMDAESGYHFFSTIAFRNWSFVTAISKRTKIQPVSWGPTVFDDPGTKVIEPSNFVEATYTKESADRVLRWRTYYNSTHLKGRFDYPLGSDTEDNQTCSCGDWVGTQLTYRFGAGRFGMLTVGTEGKTDIRAVQSSGDAAPVPMQFVYIDRRERSLGFFGQDEMSLSPRWKLDWGVRLDVSAYRHSFVSPRLALIYQPSARVAWKVLYGRAFRNPSAFHLFFTDGISAAPNPSLRPENADTFEVNLERKLGTRFSLVAAAYGYELRDFLAGTYTADGLLQYQNLGGVRAVGTEFEATARPWNGVEATASYALQHATDSRLGTVLPNSAAQQLKGQVSTPLGTKLYASSALQFYSSRKTLAGASLDPVFLADFTATTRGLLPNLDVRLGLRNAFDRRYRDPIALNPKLDSMQQLGRSLFLELIVHAAR